MPAFVVQIIVSMCMKFLTQGIIEKTVLVMLKQLAKSTDNQVDDELVSIVEEAFQPAPKSGQENGPF
jgi:hypothetical protein